MNPILQAIGGNRMGQIAAIKSMIAGKNPGAVYNMLMQNNPQFKQFINSNQGKTPEQIARENGIDPDVLRQILG